MFRQRNFFEYPELSDVPTIDLSSGIISRGSRHHTRSAQPVERNADSVDKYPDGWPARAVVGSRASGSCGDA